MRTSGQETYRDDDTLTVAAAARIAQRSVRTVRRAYRSGKLIAHRDGNGRSVRIRFRDLRHWLLAEEITPVVEANTRPLEVRVDVRMPDKNHAQTDNLKLLTAARERRRRGARVSR